MNKFASSPAYLNGLPPTGQTTVYVTGDNGTNQTGVPHRYEVRTDGQFSGTTNITVNSKTDAHSNAVVVDHQFKLMYSKTLSASVGPTSNGLVPWTTNGNGEGVFPYITAANAASYAGYGDWRLPTDIELFSIRDMEQPTGLPDPNYFSIVGVATFSSTTTPTATTSVNYVLFSNGTDFTQAKTLTGRVLLVRSV